MKKIISLLILVATLTALLTSLVSCELLGMGSTNNGENGNAVACGLVSANGKTYFVTAEGTVEIDGNAAKAVATAPEGEASSKKFIAPDTFAATFTYEAFGSGITITGVSGADVVMVPKTIDGKTVLGINESAFNGVKAVIIPDLCASITVNNGAFKGAGKVYIATAPDSLLVGKDLLTGTTGVSIFISVDEYANFKEHYNWKNHKDSLQKF